MTHRSALSTLQLLALHRSHALPAALKEGQLHGAYLDVFETEPLPKSSALWGLDNLLMSPHCIDVTPKMMHGAMAQFVDNARLFCEGKALQNQADKHAGY